MIKLLHKKDLPTEESPIMLQRRHTIMDVEKQCTLEEPHLKTIARSNSTSSLNQSKNKHLEEKAADTTLSPEGSITASNASTVVITESELSSSWLYNNKKAQMKTSEAGSPRKSSRMAEVNDEMTSPMIPKSRTRSNSMVGRQTKKSSCCCYALIALIISVAVLGILAAVASILYMEFFASYNITDIQITTTEPVSQNNVPLKKVGHYSVGVENQKVLNPTRTSESVLFTQSSAKGIEKVISSENQTSNEDGLAFDEKKEREAAKESVDSSNVIIDDLLNITSQMINSVISDQKEISNPINALFSRNQNLESHYSKLFELYQGLRPSASGIGKTVKSELNMPISQTSVASTDFDISVKNDSRSVLSPNEEDNPSLEEKVRLDFVKGSSNAVDEISSELVPSSSMNEKEVKNGLFVDDGTVEGLSEVPEGTDDVAREVPVFDVSKDLSEDSSHFRPNKIIEENRSDSLNMAHQNLSEKLEFTRKETEEFNQKIGEQKTAPDDSVKIETFPQNPLPRTPDDNLEFPNSFRALDLDFEENKIHEEQPKVEDPDQPLANLPISGATNTSNFIPKFLTQLDRTWGISTLFRNSDGDSQSDALNEQLSVTEDETDSADLNLPIRETNIAIPRPVEMIRRFGNEDKEQNELSDDLIDHDRRFSLAKALDRLRLLDTNNFLPSSRQSKTVSPIKKKEPKVPTDQEVATERSHYLEHLRRKFFDNE